MVLVVEGSMQHKLQLASSKSAPSWTEHSSDLHHCREGHWGIAQILWPRRLAAHGHAARQVLGVLEVYETVALF